jgi:hypothetical protein
MKTATRAYTAAPAGSWLMVDRTLAQIFLSNGCAFCLMWWPYVSYLLAGNGRQLLSSISSTNVRLFLSVVLLPPSDCLLEWRGRTLLGTREISHANCKQHIPVPSSASTERVGEMASEITVRRDTLAWVCGRSNFWGAYSRQLAWSVRPSAASSTSCSSSSSPGDACCCCSSGDRSRDCTTYIFLYRLSTTTSNIHTRCLVWMEPLMPWASVHYVLRICACFTVVYCLCE